MVTGTGGITCHNCGQSNTGDGQFCVRCGDRLPEPGSTPPPATGENPWEPPAEWNPDPQWESSGGGGQQTWDEQSRTWGTSGSTGPTSQGAGGAYTPPPSGYPQGGTQQGTFQQQGTYQQQAPQAPQQSHQPGTPPPGYPSAPGPAGSGGGSPRRSRTPLLAGLGALIVVVLVVLGIVLVANSGGDDGPSGPTAALNGEETKTPEQVLDDARVNLRTTSGVHAAGNVNSDGQNIRLDLDFSGSNAVKGILTIEGNDVQIIKIGDEVYLKGDRDFYLSVANGDESAVDAIGTKWLKATGDDAKDFNEFTLDGFADAFKANDSDSKLNPTLGRETFQGQPVVVLTQADGSRLLVANTGKAYPLRLENKSGSEAGQIDFSNYDRPVEISAPPASDVLDLSEVG